MHHCSWGYRWCWARALGVALCASAVATDSLAAESAASSSSVREHVWVLDEGFTTITFDRSTLDVLGVRAGATRAPQSTKRGNRRSSRTVTLTTDPGSRLLVEEGPNGIAIVGGALRHARGIVLSDTNVHRTIAPFTIADDDRIPVGDLLGRSADSTNAEGLWLRAVTTHVDGPSRSVTLWTDEATLSPALAAALGIPGLTSVSVATVAFEGRFRRLVTDAQSTTTVDTLLDFDHSARVTSGGSIGPDVIVVSLPSYGNWGSEIDPDTLERISAFSVGTTSCNIGDEPAAWVADTNQHPVIAQNLYRLKDGRFEQVGMSWLKHGFFATHGTQCGDCIIPPGVTGASLGVNCSDPYGANLNGTQNNLGPRSAVNAFTGFFPFPFNRQHADNNIDRRLQARTADLDPAMNPTALYFVEGQYVTPDDAAARNDLNNASYRPAAVFHPSPSNNNCNNLALDPATDVCLIPTGTTKSQLSAIHAWKVNDPSVEETEVFVPGEGLFDLAVKVTDLGTGFWRYEYALANRNSHRSAGSFQIPLPLGAVLENIGFHAPFYHSGEPYDNAPWTPDKQADKIVWSTTPYAQNQNANALRWSTLYNFRFDANVSPESTSATIGLFRPGTPELVTAQTLGPTAGFVDCNANTILDTCDISCAVPGCTSPCGGSADCNANGIPDECEPDCNGNLVADECDLRDLTSEDCDGNQVPDECDPDCDSDGTPDACELDLDADDDGVDDCFDLCPDTSPPGSCLCPELDLCCLPVGICIPDFPRSACVAQGGTPACETSPCRDGCLVGDWDTDGDLDLYDMSALLECFTGFAAVGQAAPSANCALRFDFDNESDIDVDDFRRFRDDYTGP